LAERALDLTTSAFTEDAIIGFSLEIGTPQTETGRQPWLLAPGLERPRRASCTMQNPGIIPSQCSHVPARRLRPPQSTLSPPPESGNTGTLAVHRSRETHHGRTFLASCHRPLPAPVPLRPAVPCGPVPGPPGPCSQPRGGATGCGKGRQAQEARPARPRPAPAQLLRRDTGAARPADVPRMPGHAQRRSLCRIHQAARKKTALSLQEKRLLGLVLYPASPPKPRPHWKAAGKNMAAGFKKRTLTPGRRLENQNSPKDSRQDSS
jgi:hypothetical protein